MTERNDLDVHEDDASVSWSSGSNQEANLRWSVHPARTRLARADAAQTNMRKELLTGRLRALALHLCWCHENIEFVLEPVL